MHQNDFNYEVCSSGDLQNVSWCVEYILSTGKLNIKIQGIWSILFRINTEGELSLFENNKFTVFEYEEPKRVKIVILQWTL